MVNNNVGNDPLLAKKEYWENNQFTINEKIDTITDFGVPLKAGEVIYSGALELSVYASPEDHFCCKFDLWGEVEITLQPKVNRFRVGHHKYEERETA